MFCITHIISVLCLGTPESTSALYFRSFKQQNHQQKVKDVKNVILHRLHKGYFFWKKITVNIRQQSFALTSAGNVHSGDPSFSPMYMSINDCKSVLRGDFDVTNKS